MEFFQPATWSEALVIKAAHPDAMPIVGGTDVMVEINLDRHRPAGIIDLTRIRELREWGTDDGWLRIGAAVTYARLIDELGDRLPGLAMASRTVGSPQIRNRGTVGGNLGTASPAGDAHPPLLASDAKVELVSTSGTRRVPVREFFTGPKRSAMKEDELIAAFLVEPAPGAQQFSKVGTRNAMVIAVCSFALSLDPDRRRVGQLRPRDSSRASWTGKIMVRSVRLRSVVLEISSRRLQSRSTICAAPPPTGATRWRSWRVAVSRGHGPRREDRVHGQWPGAIGRRRVGRRESALRAAREIRPLRIEECL
jgi:CO/xanthine dehydrogenase FAD-binding subunit